ncbi:MAG: hypothetical protein K1X44_00825 [Alphaproteobacteria bacterium]|nr:hypothetical protein [Alphaproteobacteria bacterium]
MRPKNFRILIYSHDTFGLGHLRRCRSIAHTLVEKNKDLSVLILSGSPIIGSFDFRARVDFVRIPGVIKLRNGDYTSLNLHIDIKETLAMRESIIRHTAESFRPDLFIVDKEPLGLRGEVEKTLHLLKKQDVPIILGLRDIMDDPESLAPEWKRKNIIPALQNYYDQIWVYGLPQICNPLSGIKLSEKIEEKIFYTGYLKRHLPSISTHYGKTLSIKEPYILVTTGGGGDGDTMIDWVLRAYEKNSSGLLPAVLILGPFMPSHRQAEFLTRAVSLKKIKIISFDTNIEHLMMKAEGIVAMGGYNTFCEILSFDKKALVIPRVKPRLEQYIRAERAEKLGLIKMLPENKYQDTEIMIKYLKNLPKQNLPSTVSIPGLLEGQNNVQKLAKEWLTLKNQRRNSSIPEKSSVVKMKRV